MSTLEAFAAGGLWRNPHVQTFGGALPLHAPPRGFDSPATQWRKLAIPGTHGALLTVGWWQPGARPRPTVLVVHGVGGSSESLYAVRAGVALYRAGYNVVRVNLRGAGEGVVDAPALYHAGLTEDLTLVANALALDARVTKTFVLGFSLGGNASLKAAGEWAGAPPRKVAGVATISAPTELASVSRGLETASTLPYRAYVLAHLVAQASRFRALHPAQAHWPRGSLRRLRTLWAYDELVVAPMHGFASARAYYEAASSAPYLGRIELPTLVVHAEDDPMVPGATVLPALKSRSPAVEIAWSPAGGHVGWFSALGSDPFVNTWAMKRVLPFFATLA